MPEGPFSFTGPQYAGRMDDWLAFTDMRMKYLEQAWNASVWGTDSVAPHFATINQVSSSYSPANATDKPQQQAPDRKHDLRSFS